MPQPWAHLPSEPTLVPCVLAALQPKLGDFGSLRAEARAHTRVVGTPGYLCPEYCHTSIVSDRSDVYRSIPPRLSPYGSITRDCHHLTPLQRILRCSLVGSHGSGCGTAHASCAHICCALRPLPAMLRACPWRSQLRGRAAGASDREAPGDEGGGGIRGACGARQVGEPAGLWGIPCRRTCLTHPSHTPAFSYAPFTAWPLLSAARHTSLLP